MRIRQMESNGVAGGKVFSRPTMADFVQSDRAVQRAY